MPFEEPAGRQTPSSKQNGKWCRNENHCLESQLQEAMPSGAEKYRCLQIQNMVPAVMPLIHQPDQTTLPRGVQHQAQIRKCIEVQSNLETRSGDGSLMHWLAYNKILAEPYSLTGWLFSNQPVPKGLLRTNEYDCPHFLHTSWHGYPTIH